MGKPRGVAWGVCAAVVGMMVGGGCAVLIGIDNDYVPALDGGSGSSSGTGGGSGSATSSGTGGALCSGKIGFGAPESLTVEDGPTFVATADLNGDKKPDLIVASPEDRSVSVLFGLGNGKFD